MFGTEVGFGTNKKIAIYSNGVIELSFLSHTHLMELALNMVA